MKILITGGAGFIGSHLVDRLSKDKNNTIIILDNFHRSEIKNIKQHSMNRKVRLIKGDIRNKNLIKKIAKVDVVYHLAAQSNVVGAFLNPDYAVSTNIEGTFNMIKYAIKEKISKFIFFSSREVYGNPNYLPVDEKHSLSPNNIYGATKVSGEMLCSTLLKNQNIKFTILRIANTYGPRDKNRVIPIFLDNAKKNKPLVLFGGKQVLDFIWIDDLIKAIIKISKSDSYSGKSINVGTGKGTSIESLAKLIKKTANSKSKIIRKNARNIDVEKFISKSENFSLKTLKLEKGLKKMLNE